MWKRKLQFAVWCVLGLAILVLLVAAMQKKNQKICTGTDITIVNTDGNGFIDRSNMLALMSNSGGSIGNEIAMVDLKKIESGLKTNVWISDAELFFDNNQVLHADITAREPIARIFTMQGTSFYIDSNGLRLPLISLMNVRVPVFTSFPSDNKRLARPDSAVLADVKKIAQYIQKDSFWMAQVAQVDITSQRKYEIITVLGNQTILLGNAENLEEKFLKLFSFYKQVWSKFGFEKYETIDVQFEGQVVAIRRGAAKPVMDSAKAMLVFSGSSNMLSKVLRDTTYSAPVLKIDTSLKNKKAPVANTIKPKANVKKSIEITPVKPKAKPPVDMKKPKAVLKKPIIKNKNKQ